MVTCNAGAICQIQWSVLPDSSAVLVGSSTTFTCHTNSKKACFIYRIGISDSKVVDVCRKEYDNKFAGRCNVTPDGTDGTSTLTINDVRLNDAGFYTCESCYEKGKATAQLLVLGKN